MKFNEAKIGRIEFLQRPIARMVQNGVVVWSKEKPYLKVLPDFIWLTSDSNSSADFNVESNTEWNIE